MRLFCFGFGYSARALAPRLLERGWSVAGTTRSPEKRSRLEDEGIRMVPFDRATPVPADALEGTTHLLVSVATDAEGDPVLGVHAADLLRLETLAWVGYLSSTTVYGDQGGAWVDEGSTLRPTQVRSVRRAAAEQAWLTSGMPAHVFRLAGIYGPGRNVLDRLRAGTAKHVVKEGQVFSRIHVEDIANVLEASIDRPAPGTVYNVCDDLPATGSELLLHAAALLGVEPPPPVPFEEADLTPMAKSFYADNRKVSNRRIKETLGVTLAYPTYREGLAALARD